MSERGPTPNINAIVNTLYADGPAVPTDGTIKLIARVVEARDEHWRQWCVSQDSSLGALHQRIAALEATLARAAAMRQSAFILLHGEDRQPYYEAEWLRLGEAVTRYDELVDEDRIGDCSAHGVVATSHRCRLFDGYSRKYMRSLGITPTSAGVAGGQQEDT